MSEAQIQETAGLKVVAPEPNAPPPGNAVVFSSKALTILAILATITAMWAAQEILIPTATAALLALVLTPVVKAVERVGLPTNAAAFFVVTIFAGAIVGGAIMVAPGVQEWIDKAPQFMRTIERKSLPIKAWLVSVQTATARLESVTNIHSADGIQRVVEASSGSAILTAAPSVFAQTIYVIVLAFCLITGRATYRKRLIMMHEDRENRLRMTRILNEALSQVSRYLFVTTAINFAVGVTVTLAFMALNVPYAAVWGLIFGLASFIPYLGPTGAIAFCIVAQLVTAPTLEQAVAPPIVLLVINLIESSFLTPWIVSRRLELSPLAVFLSVAVFAWAWGPLASIVAVPLLILLCAISHHVPSLRPIALLLLTDGGTAVESGTSGLSEFFDREKALESGKPSNA